jgi:hypothetical protein
MKGEDGYVKAFLEGYHGAMNTYLLTSNMSDAYMLGAYHKANHWQLPYTIRKSRGYTWMCGHYAFRVDGKVVTELNKAMTQFDKYATQEGETRGNQEYKDTA